MAVLNAWDVASFSARLSQKVEFALYLFISCPVLFSFILDLVTV